MRPHERRGVAFGASTVVLYALLVAAPALGFALPLGFSITVGLFATACGLCSAYFLARALGERLAA
ncbi:hypothetical protein [Salarchaeum japonicum]|uniref:Uncharacterized protein n=1 Tax=Salarchaeum japonicum TaxID=555573 RepID=A0AAV3SY44_9EURY|nr:hypothetical protein [Salarchaeum japonicum]